MEAAEVQSWNSVKHAQTHIVTACDSNPQHIFKQIVYLLFPSALSALAITNSLNTPTQHCFVSVCMCVCLHEPAATQGTYGRWDPHMASLLSADRGEGGWMGAFQLWNRSLIHRVKTDWMTARLVILDPGNRRLSELTDTFILVLCGSGWVDLQHNIDKKGEKTERQSSRDAKGPVLLNVDWGWK